MAEVPQAEFRPQQYFVLFEQRWVIPFIVDIIKILITMVIYNKKINTDSIVGLGM